MKRKLLIVHGGAPTAVINASLYGAVKEALDSQEFSHVYGARGGTEGIINADFIELGRLDASTLEKLPFTPASAIGTSRFSVRFEGYEQMVRILIEHGITDVLFNGGNGSMDTCGKLAGAMASDTKAKNIRVAGSPKTIDNDIAITDHAPGFGSAARYLAASIRELARDIASLPIHVCIVESMGRNAGWLTAAAMLAKESETEYGPHLIYVPEVPFDEERFLDEAASLYKKFGGVLVVASEGLRDKDGNPIVEPIFKVGRSVYYGDVSAHLSNMVIKRLGIKARSEKPGVLGRCSIAHQSDIDREEAIIAGREAVTAVLQGHTEVMVGFKRLSSVPYRCEPFLIPIEDVMLHEKTLPLEYVETEHAWISETYERWCRPLIGRALPDYAQLK